MQQVLFITVVFSYRRTGQWQCDSHESAHLKPEQVEPYIERVCARALDAGIQLTSIEVRNNIPPNKWGPARMASPMELVYQASAQVILGAPPVMGERLVFSNVSW